MVRGGRCFPRPVARRWGVASPVPRPTAFARRVVVIARRVNVRVLNLCVDLNPGLSSSTSR